jgi:hypothetical protein
MIDPVVSVPTDTAQRFAATATADPELDPSDCGPGRMGCGSVHPGLFHPLDDLVDRS